MVLVFIEIFLVYSIIYNLLAFVIDSKNFSFDSIFFTTFNVFSIHTNYLKI